MSEIDEVNEIVVGLDLSRPRPWRCTGPPRRPAGPGCGCAPSMRSVCRLPLPLLA